MAMGYWSDLPSDLVISIASRLSEPRDYARFRTVCRSWESAVRGFCPSFFPWLIGIPLTWDPIQDDVSFFSHHASSSNNCIYKRRIGVLCGGGGNINVDRSYFSSSKDGWMVLVRREDGVPIIVNPLTGAQLIQPLPSLRTLSKRRLPNIGSINFLPDNNVAFLEQDYHVLAAAAPGDDEWSATRISEPRFNSSIVFHETDNKFYILTRNGDMHSFRLIRCGGRKTVFGEVSSTLAKATRPLEYLSFSSRLMFDGTSLLQVRKYYTSRKFDILKYSPDADMWVKMTDMDFGNNALFFDQYGARMLPLPLPHHQREEEVRRNCIYFINRESENDQCIHYVGMYDIGKGTMDPYFSTIHVQSDRDFFRLIIMWFTPSLSIKN